MQQAHPHHGNHVHDSRSPCCCFSTETIIHACSLIACVRACVQTLAASLDEAVRLDDSYFNKLIRIMAIRCMTQAAHITESATKLTRGLIDGVCACVQTLAASLDEAVRPDDSYFNKLIRIMATRCMTQAVYFGSGEVEPPEYLHYGLAAPLYTHFTSPIRR